MLSNIEFVRKRLAQIATDLDRCLEFCRLLGRKGCPISADTLERKVQYLIFDPSQNVPKDEELSWFGEDILGTRNLLLSLESDPANAEATIAAYIPAWFVQEDGTPDPRSNEEKLRCLVEGTCALMQGFRMGVEDWYQEELEIELKWRLHGQRKGVLKPKVIFTGKWMVWIGLFLHQFGKRLGPYSRPPH